MGGARARGRYNATSGFCICSLITDGELPILFLVGVRKIKGVYQGSVDTHFRLVVEGKDTNVILMTTGRSGQHEGVSPIFGRHSLRENVVTLLGLIRDVGVWTALENSNLLAVTGFDICTGEVSCVSVFLAGPYIIYLACVQDRRMQCVTNRVVEPEFLPLRQRIFTHEVLFCLGCINGVVNGLSRNGRTVVHYGIIFRCDDRKMATLR